MPLAKSLRTALPLLLLAAAGCSQAPKPVPLPEGISPLPDASAERLRSLLAGAERYRGLTARRPIAAGALAESGLRARVLQSMRDHVSEAELRAAGSGLKAFGLIPESMDLAAYLPELLTSQVAGYYDAERKYLVMVQRPSWGRPDGRDKGPSEDDLTLVHELTHALQDQNFDLRRLQTDDELLSDAGTAATALIEGDATLAMVDFAAGARVELLPGADRLLSSMAGDPGQLAKTMPDVPGADELARAPAWLRDNLLFGYLQGLSFCVSVRQRGGQRLLDYAFTADPPRSSEQVLHPEKWHTRRDDPVVVRLPDLAEELPGYRRAVEGEMGELGIRSLLLGGLKDGRLTDGGRAVAAAAGWGGDRFAVWENAGGGRFLGWVTEWDAEADAREFREALAALPGWRLSSPSPRRVVALRGDLPDGRLAALESRLAAATVRRPANREIDLGAIGARPES